MRNCVPTQESDGIPLTDNGSARSERKKAIAYQYGWENGKLIHISQLREVELSDRKQRNFTCLACQKPLITRIGKVRQAHYAHKCSEDSNSCNGETYLHRLAKILFYQAYSQAIATQTPFKLKLEQQEFCNRYHSSFDAYCPIGSRINSFDLTRRWDQVQMEGQISIDLNENGSEGRNREFVADILLTSSKPDQKPLLIEFVGTHKCTPEKRNSGLQIIEIKLEDESSLDWIEKREIPSNSQIELINIHPKATYRESCEGQECPTKIAVVQVEQDGTTNLLLYPTSVALEAIQTIQSKQETQWVGWFAAFEKYGENFQQFQRLLREAQRSGVSIKDCVLCFHSSVEFERRIYNDSSVNCHKFRGGRSHKDAVICHEYALYDVVAQSIKPPRILKRLD